LQVNPAAQPTASQLEDLVRHIIDHVQKEQQGYAAAAITCPILGQASPPLVQDVESRPDEGSHSYFNSPVPGLTFRASTLPLQPENGLSTVTAASQPRRPSPQDHVGQKVVGSAPRFPHGMTGLGIETGWEDDGDSSRNPSRVSSRSDSLPSLALVAQQWLAQSGLDINIQGHF